MTDEELQNFAYDALQRGDFALAEKLVKSFNDKDSEYALATLGWMYLNGHIGMPDIKIARTYFERGVALGHEEAHYQFALLLVAEKDFEQAAEIINSALNTFSDCDRFRYLDLISQVQDHIASENIEIKDYSTAIKILESQKEPKSEYALVTLGWLYKIHGVDGNKDIKLARVYFERANALGSVESHFQLGMIELEEGNLMLARQEFGEGARLLHLPSMSKFAEMLIDGEGG